MALTTNAAGTDIVDPLFIGSAIRPRCFGGRSGEQLRFDYHASKKAWMNGEIFNSYLESLNERMVEEDRKVLMLVDNAPCHKLDEDTALSNINVKMLPRIQLRTCSRKMRNHCTFKAHVKQRQLQNALEQIDMVMAGRQDRLYEVAMGWTRDAWRCVSQLTVVKCWERTGIVDCDLAPFSERVSELNLYTQEELEFALNEVHQGRRGTDVARDTGISYETIMRKVRLLKAGKDLTPKRRGPKPLFLDSFEQDMVAWISAMQQEGMPATRFVVLLKANKLLRRLDPLRTVTGSWYRRFMNRHPELTTRVAQVISNARKSVDEVGLKRLFDSMEEAIRVHGLTAERMFNMDETSFASRHKSKDVVALKELMHEIDQTKKERDAAAKKTKEMRAIRAKKKKKNEITSIGADEQGLDDVDGNENNVGDDN
ncbi:hypothetical protein DYB26_009882 [Aphanomyces astaci]|uniref:HTH CENPB-type domain-containing protein n=1 Tax=Aphanomyces astaci TaxID=112090 RepID=A0A3R7B3I5_APHAT|nr:hypothetical protein DYB26_009882 [Aphanomyces astaci]